MCLGGKKNRTTTYQKWHGWNAGTDFLQAISGYSAIKRCLTDSVASEHTPKIKKTWTGATRKQEKTKNETCAYF